MKIRDPKDGPVLAAAIRAKAQVIVTSDRDSTADVLAELENSGLVATAAALRTPLL